LYFISNSLFGITKKRMDSTNPGINKNNTIGASSWTDTNNRKKKPRKLAIPPKTVAQVKTMHP
jgi:hypothetical protein